jgi:flagellar hook assembly protein FlgD
MSNGKHSIVWDGKDNNGHIWSSGVYCYKIESNGRVEVKKMLLLK